MLCATRHEPTSRRRVVTKIQSGSKDEVDLDSNVHIGIGKNEARGYEVCNANHVCCMCSNVLLRVSDFPHSTTRESKLLINEHAMSNSDNMSLNDRYTCHKQAHHFCGIELLLSAHTLKPITSGLY